MKKIVSRGLAAASLVAVGAANAAGGPDISAVTQAGADVATVGAAVFAVYVAVKGFKWIRAAL